MAAARVMAMLVHAMLSGAMEDAGARLRSRYMEESGGAEDAAEARACELAEQLLGGCVHGTRVYAEDACAVLSLVERLGVLDEDDRAELLRALAEAAVFDSDFRSGVAQRRETPGLEAYMLQMLRECADTHDVEVRVEDGAATLCPRGWHPRGRHGSAERVEAVQCLRVLREALERLDLEECPLAWFADTMGVRELDLSECSLSEWTVRSLREMRGVRSLRMRGCGMTEGIFKHLDRELVRGLEKVDVAQNTLDKSDVLWLGKMRGLVELDVSQCNLGPGSLARALEHAENLEKLRALGNRLDVRDVERAGELLHLQHLEIGVCNVPAGSLALLCKLAELEVLRVSCRALSSADFAGISELGRLVRLEVCGDSMAAGSLGPLSGHAGLRDLSVMCGELSADDLRAIGQMEGLRRLRLGRVVRGRLRHLRAAAESEAGGAMEMGAKGLGRLQELAFTESKLDGGDMQEIGQLRSLEVLDICGCGVRAGCVASLRGLASLRELRMYGNSIDKEDLREIGQMASITLLDIGNCCIAPGSLRHLRRAAKRRRSHQGGVGGTFRRLWSLRRTRSVPEEGAKEREASAGGGEGTQSLDEGGIQERLVVLRVSENKLSGGDLEEIGRMRGLQRLLMDYCEAKAESMWSLLALKSLVELSAADFPGSMNEEKRAVMHALRAQCVQVRGD